MKNYVRKWLACEQKMSFKKKKLTVGQRFCGEQAGSISDAIDVIA